MLARYQNGQERRTLRSEGQRRRRSQPRKVNEGEDHRHTGGTETENQSEKVAKVQVQIRILAPIQSTPGSLTPGPVRLVSSRKWFARFMLLYAAVAAAAGFVSCRKIYDRQCARPIWRRWLARFTSLPGRRASRLAGQGLIWKFGNGAGCIYDLRLLERTITIPSLCEQIFHRIFCGSGCCRRNGTLQKTKKTNKKTKQILINNATSITQYILRTSSMSSAAYSMAADVHHARALSLSLICLPSLLALLGCLSGRRSGENEMQPPVHRTRYHALPDAHRG